MKRYTKDFWRGYLFALIQEHGFKAKVKKVIEKLRRNKNGR